jgi:hypothetical protein
MTDLNTAKARCSARQRVSDHLKRKSKPVKKVLNFEAWQFQMYLLVRYWTENFKNLTMKKVSLIFLILVVANLSARPWWATALVDGGGALGGGSSVSGLCPPCLGSPPWGWVAIGAGGLLGGAAASLAIAQPQGGKDYTNLEKLPESEFGILHNQICIDYTESYGAFDKNTYIGFINDNQSKYKIDLKNQNANLNLDIIVSESLKVSSLEDSKIVEFIISNFENAGDKSLVGELLNKIQGYAKYEDFKADQVELITNYSGKMSSSSEKYKLQLFYSIFAYSSALNN